MRGGGGGENGNVCVASTFANNWQKMFWKNAIKVAPNATCLLKYFVGRQKMLAMWQAGGKGEQGEWGGGVACQQSTRPGLLLIVINATKTCAKYASCALLLRFMAHGAAHTHTHHAHSPPPPHLPVKRCKTNSKLSKCLRNVVEFQVCFKYLRNSKNPENVFNYI